MGKENGCFSSAFAGAGNSEIWYLPKQLYQ